MKNPRAFTALCLCVVAVALAFGVGPAGVIGKTAGVFALICFAAFLFESASGRRLFRSRYDLSLLKEVHERKVLAELDPGHVSSEADEIVCPACGQPYPKRILLCPRCRC